MLLSSSSHISMLTAAVFQINRSRRCLTRIRADPPLSSTNWTSKNCSPAILISSAFFLPKSTNNEWNCVSFGGESREGRAQHSFTTAYNEHNAVGSSDRISYQSYHTRVDLGPNGKPNRCILIRLCGTFGHVTKLHLIFLCISYTFRRITAGCFSRLMGYI